MASADRVFLLELARFVESLSPQIGTKVSLIVPFIALIIDNCIGSGGLLLLKQAVKFPLFFFYGTPLG